MNWTKRMPTEDGMYWYCRAGDKSITPIYVREKLFELGVMEARFPEWDRYEAIRTTWQGLWYGPMLPPAPPTTTPSED